MSRRALRTDPECAGADPSLLTIALTREQQLEVLVATGLMVSTLELLLEGVEDGGEALARLPLPDWLKEREIPPEGKGVNRTPDARQTAMQLANEGALALRDGGKAPRK